MTAFKHYFYLYLTELIVLKVNGLNKYELYCLPMNLFFINLFYTKSKRFRNGNCYFMHIKSGDYNTTDI